MLPRVTAALAKFITPLDTQGGKAAGDGVGTGPGYHGRRRRLPNKEKEADSSPVVQAAPELAKAAPLPSAETGEEAEPAPSKAPGTAQVAPEGEGQPSIAATFLQIIAAFRKGDRASGRQSATGAYRESARRRKKNARGLKGIVVDFKVE